MVSWIQKHALYILLRQESATVKEMRPPDVEANLFSYHLDGLQSNGYIQRVSRGTYTLTAAGQRFVGAFSTSTNRASEFIKTVIMLYAKTEDGRFLLFRWSRQPYINHVGLIHDHMTLGKTLEDAVNSAMIDKIGTVTPCIYMTSAIVRITHGDELVAHMNALVYEVDIRGIPLPYTSRNGTAFLGNMSDAPDLICGVDGLIAGIERRSTPSEYILTY